MKLINLTLKEGLINKRFIEFSDSTLICSYNNNKRGKTTLIRLMIYALGFNIPSIVGINFSQIDSILEIEINGKRFFLHRNDSLMDYKADEVELKFILPRDELKLFSLIFDTSNLYVLQNILGAMYVDQTHGGVVLNRGKIINNINFSVDTLIAGIQGQEISEIKQRIDNETKVLKDYKAMQAIAEYIEQNNIKNIDISDVHIPDENQLENERVELKSKLRKKQNEIEVINEAINSNESFLKTIESYHLYVLDNDRNKIRVDSSTVMGYEDNSKILKANLRILEVEKKKIQKSISKLGALSKAESLDIDVETFREHIDNNLRGININLNTINSLVDSTKKELSLLRKSIQTKIQKDSSVTDYMNSVITRCADKLGVIKLLDDRGVLTRTIKNKSGTNYYELIISFKIGYIKTIEKFCDISLPFIIDSFRQNELSAENAKLMLKVIKEELPKHQLILTSIFDYSKLFETTIGIHNRVIE